MGTADACSDSQNRPTVRSVLKTKPGRTMGIEDVTDKSFSLKLLSLLAIFLACKDW
jgi:hypothetical protein